MNIFEIFECENYDIILQYQDDTFEIVIPVFNISVILFHKSPINISICIDIMNGNNASYSLTHEIQLICKNHKKYFSITHNEKPLYIKLSDEMFGRLFIFLIMSFNTYNKLGERYAAIYSESLHKLNTHLCTRYYGEVEEYNIAPINSFAIFSYTYGGLIIYKRFTINDNIHEHVISLIDEAVFRIFNTSIDKVIKRKMLLTNLNINV